MDKRLKIVIAVLIVLAVLFVSGVLGNLIPKQREGTKTKDDYVKGEKGWEKTLGEWMSPFAPSLEVGKLLRENRDSCASQRYESKYTAIRLDAAKEVCVIEIPELVDENYAKGKLRLAEMDSREVTALYLPNGDDSEEKPEPEPIGFDEGVSFVVLEAGGTLSVACEGCFKDRKEAILVIFE